jgi:hypothetical protein
VVVLWRFEEEVGLLTARNKARKPLHNGYQVCVFSSNSNIVVINFSNNHSSSYNRATMNFFPVPPRPYLQTVKDFSVSDSVTVMTPLKILLKDKEVLTV